MNTVVNCKLNGKKLKVSNNFVQIEDSILQLELVKKLVYCRSITPVGESALPMFFNKYLRKYKLSEVVFMDEKLKFVSELDFENRYIDEMIDGMVDGLAA